MSKLYNGNKFIFSYLENDFQHHTMTSIKKISSKVQWKKLVKINRRFRKMLFWIETSLGIQQSNTTLVMSEPSVVFCWEFTFFYPKYERKKYEKFQYLPLDVVGQDAEILKIVLECCERKIYRSNCLWNKK